MLNNSLFCLKGMGYLHDLRPKNDGIKVRINVIHQFNSNSQHSGDVWIHCLVKDELLVQFLLLVVNDIKLQKTVIVSFEVAYCKFQYSQSGMTDEDPENIVHFKGTLQKVDECYINGVSQQDKHNLPSTSSNIFSLNKRA